MIIKTLIKLPALLLAMFLLTWGCQGQGTHPVSPTIHRGDLAAIKKHGRLRILTRRLDRLPRTGSALEREWQLISQFAAGQGLEPQVIYLDNVADLFPALLAGKGDIVGANITVTPQRKKKVIFTAPFAYTREQLVISAAGKPLRSLKELKGRSIAVQAGTSFVDKAGKLQETYPGLKIAPLKSTLTRDEILDMVAEGKINMTIFDKNLLEDYLAYRSDVKGSLYVGKEKPLAWALRPNCHVLKEKLDRFLTIATFQRAHREREKLDLPGIKKRKIIRMITSNSAASYFLYKGKLVGFEYKMALEFAKRHRLVLEVIVAEEHADMIAMLKAGQGDFIAAMMTITQQRMNQGIAFGRPYLFTREVLVLPVQETGLTKPAHLAGRRVSVRPSSSYWQSLTALQKQGIKVKLAAAAEDLVTEELIDQVGTGKIPLTVADRHILDMELCSRDDVKAGFPLGPERKIAWAVRQEDRALLKAIDDFWKKEYRGLIHNMNYKQYFKNQKKILRYRRERVLLAQKGKLSPYDNLVKKYAKRFAMPWRLIISQMYQESRFDPNARSFAGAMGLMQLMPATAREMGISRVTEPENGIHAGVKYMARMRDRFDPQMDIQDRHFFALASYNAGYGHVVDARRLAGKRGLDPDRWFGNVEKAMLLLSKPAYYRKARYGYVRGREPVTYVRNIRERLKIYVQMFVEQ